MRGALIAFVVACAGCGAPTPAHPGLDRCGAGEPPPHAQIIEGRDGFTRWAPPTRQVLGLSRQPTEAQGALPERAPPLAEWSGPDLTGWTSTPHGDDLRLRSPMLPRAVAGAAQVELTLRPGDLRGVSAVFFSSSGTDTIDRVSRSTRALLPEDLDPDEPYTLQIDLREFVGGNWADAWRGARLIGLELTLEGAEAAGARIEAVRLWDASARFEGAAAGADTLELGGVLRPGWYAHPDARLRLTLRVPEVNPELRWAAGAPAAGAIGELWITEGREATKLAAQQGVGAWSPRAASLAPWAGREVTLEVVNAGTGLAFFGDPRLLSGTERATQPDVLLYLVDALRPDSLGAWGSPAPGVSPTIDRLAAEGIQFTRAYSVSNWTKPAIPTLMTGLWPSQHQVGSQRFSDRLSASVPLLQERLRDAGWRTGSFSANPMGSTLSGLERGFDATSPPRRWRGQITQMGAPTAPQLHEALNAWIDEEGDEQPFFAYVHTLEVHQDYRPPFAQADLRAAYESAIRAADAALADLLGGLARRGRSRPLLVVFLSDHGDSFGDHGLWKHGTGIYDSQLRIPLVIWADRDLPSLAVDQPVSLADVAPTLLSLLGLPPLDEADGRDLRPTLQGGSVDRAFVPAALLRFAWTPDAPQQYALVTSALQKVIQRTDGAEERYDLRTDPCELEDLGSDAALGDLLRQWRADQEVESAAFEARHDAPVPSTLDPETAEQLRELGYVR